MDTMKIVINLANILEYLNEKIFNYRNKSVPYKDFLGWFLILLDQKKMTVKKKRKFI